MDAEKLLDFMNCTGATEDEAINMLFIADYDVEKAVNMHFSGHSESAQPTPAVEDNIREPISSKRQRLLDSPFDSVIRYDATMHHTGVEKRKTSAFASGSGAVGSDKQQALSKLFSPPFSIMFSGPFQEASSAAAIDNKWLMVNIQSEEEFCSHVLNRDVWSSERVQDVVRCHFVFWQQQDFTAEAKWYVTKYITTTASSSTEAAGEVPLPHVAIIDPATGVLIRSLMTSDRVPTRDAMLNKLEDFLADSPSPSDYWKAKHQRLHQSAERDRSAVQKSWGKSSMEAVQTVGGAGACTDNRSCSASTPSGTPNRDGFCPQEITAAMKKHEGDEKTSHDLDSSAHPEQGNATAMVRVMLPNGVHTIEKFSGPSETTVGTLLLRIIAKMKLDEVDIPRRFEVFFGFPLATLSSKGSLSELAYKSLIEANLANEKVTVRFV